MPNATDWKTQKKGWPYKNDAPNDKDYLKDRNKLFNENGNGWWWFQSTSMWRSYYNKYKENQRGKNKKILRRAKSPE